MFDQPPKITKSLENDFFESPIAHKKRLNINGAEVDTVSITPENLKTDVPVFVLHGWGATMESFKPGIEILAEKERPVVSLDFPRRGGTIPNSFNKEIEEWYGNKGQPFPEWYRNRNSFIKSEFLRQAHIVDGVIEQEKFSKADVIAHSMAGPSIVIEAMLHPEKFAGRTIILTNSAGLIGNDSFNRLRKGAAENKSRTPTTEGIPVTEKEIDYLKSTKHITGDYIKAGPIRAIKEVVRDIPGAQIDEYMLRYLKEKGVKVIVVGAAEDTMFPMDGNQKNIKEESIAGFVSTIGGHMQIQVNSKEFMSALETMLPQPEQKS
jgi:pimeloyl-ACP methyl ester carboxylesterase